MTDTDDPVEMVTLPVAEWQAYREVRLRALQQDPQAFSDTYARAAGLPDELWQSRLQAVLDGSAWTLFARAGGRLVGMLGAFQREEERARRQATIFGVHVERAYRGRGIARKLMAALLEELASAGIGVVRLTVNREQTAAIALYRSFGFAAVGEEHALLGDGVPHVELMMEKMLA